MKVRSPTYLLFGHPSISMFHVSVEELQVHTLLIQNFPLLPQLNQAGPLLGQGYQLQKKMSFGCTIHFNLAFAIVSEIFFYYEGLIHFFLTILLLNGVLPSL